MKCILIVELLRKRFTMILCFVTKVIKLIRYSFVALELYFLSNFSIQVKVYVIGYEWININYNGNYVYH